MVTRTELHKEQELGKAKGIHYSSLMAKHGKKYGLDYLIFILASAAVVFGAYLAVSAGEDFPEVIMRALLVLGVSSLIILRRHS